MKILFSQIRGEKIGFIFQNFNLMPVLSVSENIELPHLFLRNSSIDIDEKVKEIVTFSRFS